MISDQISTVNSKARARVSSSIRLFLNLKGKCTIIMQYFQAWCIILSLHNKKKPGKTYKIIAWTRYKKDYYWDYSWPSANHSSSRVFSLGVTVMAILSLSKTLLYLKDTAIINHNCCILQKWYKAQGTVCFVMYIQESCALISMLRAEICLVWSNADCATASR